MVLPPKKKPISPANIVLFKKQKHSSQHTEDEPIEGEHIPAGENNENSNDDSSLEISKDTTVGLIVSEIIADHELFSDSQGIAYAVEISDKNRPVLRIGNKALNGKIQSALVSKNISPRQATINEINAFLEVLASSNDNTHEVHYRNHQEGYTCYIDVGDNYHSQIILSPGKYEIVTEKTDVYFERTSVMQPLVLPETHGDYRVLSKYISVHPTTFIIVSGWITYTIFHGRNEYTNFLHAIITGEKGSGKSLASHFLRRIIDPARIKPQAFPKTEKDFAVATKMLKIIFIDNMQNITKKQSDFACRCATGSSDLNRKLFTDNDAVIHDMHLPIVFNGIDFGFLPSDLSERCVHIICKAIESENRRSKLQMMTQFEQDLPGIMAGLFDLMSKILVHLPNAIPTHPQRMIEFSAWLRAMEMAEDVPEGVYQDAYNQNLTEARIESIADDLLVTEILKFVAKEKLSGEYIWSDTPSELFSELNNQISKSAKHSHEWPRNTSAFSKRLKAISNDLLAFGLEVTHTRGKDRKIILKKVGEES